MVTLGRSTSHRHAEGQSRPATPCAPARSSSLHPSVPAAVLQGGGDVEEGGCLGEEQDGIQTPVCSQLCTVQITYLKDDVSLILPGQYVLPQRGGCG